MTSQAAPSVPDSLNRKRATDPAKETNESRGKRGRRNDPFESLRVPARGYRAIQEKTGVYIFRARRSACSLARF
jgi:hypothetical protein